MDKKYRYTCYCEETVCNVSTDRDCKPSKCLLDKTHVDFNLSVYLGKYRVFKKYNKWIVEELTGKSICENGFWFEHKFFFNTREEAVEYMLKQKETP